MFAQIINALSKLPPEIVSGVASLVESLVNAETDHDRRVAMDKAMAAAEDALIAKEFQK